MVRFVRLCYICLLHLLMPFVFLRLSFLGLRDPGYWQHWTHRLGQWRPGGDRPRVLIHAVSVGEVRSAAPLLRRLANDGLPYDLLLTTTTPGGLRLARSLDIPGLQTAHFPVDTPWAMGSFLRRTRPFLFLFMENEVWPHLYAACRRRNIPLVIANARLSARSERRYAFLSALFQPAWASLSLLAAQDQKAARAYGRLGVPSGRIHVTGNMKFDALSPAPPKEAMKTRRRWFADRPVWLAASTHPGEEEIVLQVHRRLAETLTDPVLLLAPRHPWRSEAVEKLCRQHGYRSIARRSQSQAGPASGAAVMLLDTMGELPFFYAMADIAFVGGSLTPHGGHNILEPVAAGIPALIGPHYGNFTTLVEQLTESGILFVVRNADELQKSVHARLKDPGRRDLSRRAGEYVNVNRGATERLYKLLRPFLEGVGKGNRRRTAGG